jgi:hypothetical protein
MVVAVVDRFPPDSRLVALIWFARPTHTCCDGMKFTLDSVPFSVSVCSQLGSRQWCRVGITMAFAHPNLLV